jgi:hypothetical protein
MKLTEEQLYLVLLLALFLLIFGVGLGYWMHKRFTCFIIRNFMRGKHLSELGRELICEIEGKPFTQIEIIEGNGP